MLEASGLTFSYGGGTPVLHGASLTLEPGDIVGLAGPSGVGKSTLGRILAGLQEPHAGSVTMDGSPLPKAGFCPVQMLFQTVELAVDPRWRIREILTEAHKPTPDLMQAFGIRESWLDRYPHELSGGELQRVAIVRALDDRVRFLIADEITGMLDAITQAEIWSALLSFAGRRRIGMLVISHDRDLLARVATRQMRLSQGQLVEAVPKSAGASCLRTREQPQRPAPVRNLVELTN